jgi:hypothetical protein
MATPDLSTADPRIIRPYRSNAGIGWRCRTCDTTWSGGRDAHTADDCKVATAGLGIFQDGLLIEAVPDGFDTERAYAFRDQLADKHGVGRDRYEVLIRCPNHPDVSVVDCLDCGYQP